MFTLDDIVAIVKPHNDKLVAEHKLDLAWERIAAKRKREAGDYDAGYDRGINAALRIIEELGGSDPAAKARAELESLRDRG